MRSRTATALAGLLLSLAVTAVLYYYTESFLFFLFVPFVPFLFRRGGDEHPSVRECPTCGYRTRDESFEFCPRDGTRLEK